jgi:hypothetical protein
MERRIPMRKTKVFTLAAAAALILAGVGGWVASTTQARVAPIDVEVNSPSILELMMHPGDLPTEHYVDYSVVFN